MQHQDKVKFYAERLRKITVNQQRTHKIIGLLSWMRLLCFVIVAVTIYLFAAAYGSFWLALSLFFFVVLIGLIIYHQKLYQQSEHLQAMLEVNNNEINVLNHQASMFVDGHQYAARLPFADDLDLFGNQSLFHFLNRCQTTHGKDLLANVLLQSPPGREQIQQMQEAVKEIAAMADFNQDVMVRLLLSQRQKHVKPVDLEMNNPTFLFQSKFYKVASIIMPVLVLASLVMGIVTGSYLLFMLNGAVAMMMVFRQSKKMMLLTEEIEGRTRSLRAYAGVFAAFGKMPLKAKMLKEMARTTSEASAEFKHLSVMSERFDRRNNLLLYTLGNIFLMYDFHIALAYEGWKRRYLPQINIWLNTLGRIELLISLGTYCFNQAGTVFPELHEDSLLKAESLGHPLIPDNQLVKNDITLQIDPRIVLVTGSNMSGKSTFLRTLGVNVLLAQAGAPVYARSFSWKPMHVLSSLRQSDSLQENTSLFLNELKQLKFILEKVQNDALCLVLLDEVLRGTNSEDKYTGSYHLILKLLKMNSLVVMATHDLKLSKLEESHPKQVVNYCFESHIEQGHLIFDYTIRKGIAVNRNATWLMRDMGIIE